jgi:uncharacterized protein YciI
VADPRVSETLFLVFRKPGPGWVEGRGTREQPLWDEHAAFVDRLFEQGRIVMAGPFSDGRAMIVMNADDAGQAEEMFRDDPWAPAGILVADEIREWTVFVDRERRAAGGPAPARRFSRRAYLMTTGVVFGVVALVHIWRMAVEGPALAANPWFLFATAAAAVLGIWAWRLIRID